MKDAIKQTETKMRKR